MQSENIPNKKKSISVLIVDDSAVVRQVLTALLEVAPGIEVMAAVPDPLFAMKRMALKWPDVIVLDIEMPRMDGFDVAKRVRSSQHHQALPIIIITSRTGEKHRLRGLEAGANLYMGKPYQEEALLESIRGLIKNEFISI